MIASHGELFDIFYGPSYDHLWKLKTLSHIFFLTPCKYFLKKFSFFIHRSGLRGIGTCWGIFFFVFSKSVPDIFAVFNWFSVRIVCIVFLNEVWTGAFIYWLFQGAVFSRIIVFFKSSKQMIERFAIFVLNIFLETPKGHIFHLLKFHGSFYRDDTISKVWLFPSLVKKIIFTV